MIPCWKALPAGFNNKYFMNLTEKIKAAIFGVAVGDALGVPVEFNSRTRLMLNPVMDMRGNGTHNQPAGTWSDDSSLTFCLAEMLSDEYNLHKLANRFVNWRHHGYWTPHGRVFDIGIATAAAIDNLSTGRSPILAGGRDEMDNGNGSLMRILPLAFYSKDMLVADRFEKVQEISSLTHGHIRSVMACFIYLELALQLLNGREKMEAFTAMQEIVNNFFNQQGNIPAIEANKFSRLLQPAGNHQSKPIYKCVEDEIASSGYVVSTLEAACWSFLTTGNYKDAVLTAINLGADTDTTGAVTGGLAGLYYGFNSIPDQWVRAIARTEDINDLCLRLSQKLTT